MRLNSFFIIFIAFVVGALNNAMASECRQDVYPGGEIQGAHRAIFQKTGITFSGYTNSNTEKLNCTELRSLRELVARLTSADAQERLKLREAAKLIASNYLRLQQSAIAGNFPYKTLIEISEFFYKSTRDKAIEPSSPIPEYLQQAIDSQAAIYIIHYCGGTRLADCSNR